jgi:hypothetical protein
LLLLSALALAQETNDETATAVFPHPDSRIWLSGQVNVIFQAHGSFPARYSGPNSFRNTSETATSLVMTLYTGLRLGRGAELLLDLESSAGSGLSDALGLAGFTNLDVVRNPTLGSKPYVARFMWHQTISLSHETEENERTPFSLPQPCRHAAWSSASAR